MSGKHNGMQPIIRQQSKLADCVPCATHSLNLVGQSAVGCCQLAVRFFDFIQRLYSFFVASTCHWILLNNDLMTKGLPIVKRMSDTPPAIVSTCRCYKSSGEGLWRNQNCIGWNSWWRWGESRNSRRSLWTCITHELPRDWHTCYLVAPHPPQFSWQQSGAAVSWPGS